MPAAALFRRSRDRGHAFLQRHLGADGAFPADAPSIAASYKALTAFQVCGDDRAANRMCAWIRRHGILDSGDFAPRPQAAAAGDAYTYYNAWIIAGAHRLGQFDLSRRGLAFLRGFHDPVSGGFYSSVDRRDDDTEQDLMATCMCGLAALYVGDLEIASGVGRWLQTVRDAQPDFPRLLYTVYSRAGGLVTPLPAGDGNRYLVERDADRDQNIFNPGIAAAFLCRLYQSTGDESQLELARQYLSVAEGASDFLFGIVRAGKVGWAASLLYRQTGDPRYREMAVRIGNNLAELQFEAGFWSGVGGTEPSLDSTAERVVWMDEILQVAED